MSSNNSTLSPAPVANSATTPASRAPSITPSAARNGRPWGAGASVWGSSSLSNGFGSSPHTRDNSASREAQHPVRAPTEPSIGGKTGSGSLVSSSVVDDWNHTKRMGPSNPLASRSMSTTAYAAPSTQLQQRTQSTTGPALPHGASDATPVPRPTMINRPPTINLTSTSNNGSTALPQSYQGTAVARAHEPPPNVYTKFDRQLNGKHDSATAVSWNEISPTNDRKPSVSSQYSHRSVQPGLWRDTSLDTASHLNGAPKFAVPDWTAPAATRTSPSSSRAPSISSQALGPYAGLYPSGNTDHFAFTVNSPSISGDGYSASSSRSLSSPNSYQNWAGASASTFSSARSSVHGPMATGSSLESLASVAAPMSVRRVYEGSNGYASSVQADRTPMGNLSNPSSHLQATLAPAWRPGQPYRCAELEGESPDIPIGPRGDLTWQSMANSESAMLRRPSGVANPAFFMDQQVQRMMAAMQLGAGLMYAPYHPVAAQFPQYMPPVQMGPDQAEADHMPRSLPERSVQSQLMHDFRSVRQARRWELRDLFGHIVEFAGDQLGSRFIQSKLMTANSDDKERVFEELEPNALQLMTDVFGNYVIQKFFEHGDQKHKKIFGDKLRGNVFNLSLQMYGCRVVQKAIEYVLVDQQILLIAELEKHVMKLIKDQNGNHVIQKVIERCPPEMLGSIIPAFAGSALSLSSHSFGCRIIQRCLERYDNPYKNGIIAEIIDGIPILIDDQYGNYVVQHVVEYDAGPGHMRVLEEVDARYEYFSKHKFASNVVEKCIVHADNAWRRQFIHKLADRSAIRRGSDNLIVSMVRDAFGNYVIQKILDCVDEPEYRMFIDLLKPAMSQAKRSSCGKHMAAIESKMHRFPSASASRRSSYSQRRTSSPTSPRSASYARLPPPPYAALANVGNAQPPPQPQMQPQHVQSELRTSLSHTQQWNQANVPMLPPQELLSFSSPAPWVSPTSAVYHPRAPTASSAALLPSSASMPSSSSASASAAPSTENTPPPLFTTDTQSPQSSAANPSINGDPFNSSFEDGAGAGRGGSRKSSGGNDGPARLPS